MGLKKTLSNFLQLIINKRRIYFLDKILENLLNLALQEKEKLMLY